MPTTAKSSRAGPHVMKGYWNNPQATADAIADRWLHTGDLGNLTDGFLHITGRKKDLIVLSNGKNVAPSHIEGLILADACFDQIVVFGEGRNFLSASLAPHWGNLTQAMAVMEGTPETLARDPKVRAFLEERIQQAREKRGPVGTGRPDRRARSAIQRCTGGIDGKLETETQRDFRPSSQGVGRNLPSPRMAAGSGGFTRLCKPQKRCDYRGACGAFNISHPLRVIAIQVRRGGVLVGMPRWGLRVCRSRRRR